MRASFATSDAAIILGTLAASSLFAACDCGGEGRRDRVIEEAPARKARGAETAGAEENTSGPVRIRLDLGAHFARAELRCGRALHARLGESGGAKYTLGGWQSGVGDVREIDEIQAALVPGVTARIFLPADSDEAAELTLSARAFGDGRVTVYVNDRTIAERVLDPGAFRVIRVPIEAGVLRRGENVVQLRVPKVGLVPGGARAGLAIAWLRFGPAKDAEGCPKEPTVSLAGEDGRVSEIALGAGWSLGYAIQVPEGARLRGILRGTAASSLGIVVSRDDGPSAELARISALPNGRAFDVDLGAYAGRLVRVDLAVRGGEVTVMAPAVVTPEATAPDPAPARARNVLIYLIDTLRADKLRAYEPETRVRTPGFDRFARKAAVFERGLTQENWTKPSVATLLSALYPWQHQATTGEAVLPRSVTILPELLRERGYHTGAFIANGYVSDKFGFRRGWSTFRNYIREGRRTQARFVAADVLEWLDDRPEEKPFFLYVHTIDPHVPYIPPDDLLAEYDPEPYGGPVDFKRDRTLLENIKIGRLKIGDRDRRRLEALYDGEVTYHDVHFAAILEGLERRGLAEDTIVVVTADHGEEFFDHGSVGHGHSVWQELLHVPLVVRLPGLTRSTHRIPDAAGLIDVVPTVLEALGLPALDEAQGRSLLPLLRREGERAPRVVVSGFMQGWRTAVVGSFKLIQRTWAHPMLFDLAEDPKEERDLAPEQPIALRYLRGLLGLALRGEDRPAAGSHEPESTTIDAETEAQLRALGYVGTSRP